MTKKKNITIVGAGYVGLVAGACLADLGHKVICVEHDRRRFAELSRGKLPIYEPELEDIFQRAKNSGCLSFSQDIGRAVAECDAAFIAVGTPQRKSDGKAELRFVFDSAAEIARSIRPGAIIVTKSTVPIGTGDAIADLVARVRPGIGIPVASNPEFLREGSAIGDFMEPDRIVIGCEDEASAEMLMAIYAPLIGRGHPLVRTRRRSAELIKYAANAFLATKITFINEIADLCEVINADVADISLGIGLDRRIGPHFLQVGPGYGGSCFPKDTLALVTTAQEHGISLRLVEETVIANEARKRRMAMKVRNILHGQVVGKKIAVLGLTFKAGTDDMRESPSIPFIELLQRAGAEIHAYDPQGMNQARKIFRGVSFYSDAYQCADGSDAVVIMTDWDDVKHLDLARLASIMKTPVMIDLRRVYPPEEAARQGFVVETIGRTGLEPHPVPHFESQFLISDIATATRTGGAPVGQPEKEMAH